MLKACVLFLAVAFKYRAAPQSGVLLYHLQNSTKLKKKIQNPKGHDLAQAQFTLQRLISTQSCKWKQGDARGSAHSWA